MDAKAGWYATGQILLGGILLVATGCAPLPPSGAGGPPRAEGPDLVAVHFAGAPQLSAPCLSCHGDIMKRTTLNPKFKEAHAAMIPFWPEYDAKVGVTDATCVSCHTKVDVVQHSGLQIRKNVEVASCEGCHGKTGPAKRKFYAN